MTPALALLAAAAVAAAEPRASVPLPGTAVLPDGLELVVLPIPGAASASMRLVVRAGGASDPVGHGGLAHLVEHLALAGSYDEDGDRLADDVRAAGGVLNAHTAPDLTKFELDAPAAAFPALAERLLRVVTSPAWEHAGIDTERGVIETEMDYHGGGEGLLSLVDRGAFPQPLQGGPLAGTDATRADLDVDDVAAFFATRYAPSNASIVFAGAVRLEDARALVERSFRIPPALPGEVPPPQVEIPNVPLEQRIPGWITLTLQGYTLDAADRGACEPVAALVELRLALSAQVDGPMVREVMVTCATLRGTPFLVAALYTTRLDAGDLPRALEQAFSDLARTPPSPAERAAVNARLERQRRRMLADPALLAERAAEIVADRDDRRPLAARLDVAPLPDAAALAKLARRSLSRERRILLHVSPLER